MPSNLQAAQERRKQARTTAYSLTGPYSTVTVTIEVQALGAKIVTVERPGIVYTKDFDGWVEAQEYAIEVIVDLIKKGKI